MICSTTSASLPSGLRRRHSDADARTMLQTVINKASNLAAILWRRYRPSIAQSALSFSLLPFRSDSASRYFSDNSATNDSPPIQWSELTRVPNLFEGCDYEHWLVVMKPHKGHPPRDDIISGYVKTLATVLGSQEEAKKSVYSVSTKYYYAFGCKIPEKFTYRIKALPDVRWVLPDSYLCNHECDYGGEPVIDGNVVPYDEKYHEDWVHDQNDDQLKSRTSTKRSSRKQMKT